MDRLRFDRDIRPLFREGDRDAMKWAFDLWDENEVWTNRTEILDRIRAGEMPCDDRWPDGHIRLFELWTGQD